MNKFRAGKFIMPTISTATPSSNEVKLLVNNDPKCLANNFVPVAPINYNWSTNEILENPMINSFNIYMNSFPPIPVNSDGYLYVGIQPVDTSGNILNYAGAAPYVSRAMIEVISLRALLESDSTRFSWSRSGTSLTITVPSLSFSTKDGSLHPIAIGDKIALVNMSGTKPDAATTLPTSSGGMITPTCICSVIQSIAQQNAPLIPSTNRQLFTVTGVTSTSITVTCSDLTTDYTEGNTNLFYVENIDGVDCYSTSRGACRAIKINLGFRLNTFYAPNSLSNNIAFHASDTAMSFVLSSSVKTYTNLSCNIEYDDSIDNYFNNVDLTSIHRLPSSSSNLRGVFTIDTKNTMELTKIGYTITGQDINTLTRSYQIYDRVENSNVAGTFIDYLLYYKAQSGSIKKFCEISSFDDLYIYADDSAYADDAHLLTLMLHYRDYGAL